MATQNLTNADAILKDLYVGPIVEQLNQKTYMLDQIQRDSDHIDHTGRRAVIPVHSGRNRGRASIVDGGTLPVAGRQQWQDAVVPIKYHSYGIELTDASIEATKSNEGAFVSLMEAESRGVAQDMKKDINRQVYGVRDAGGATGLLGTTGVTAGATTVVMANSNAVQYIQVGDVIDIRTQTTGAAVANGTNRTVTARNVSGATISIADGGGNVTTAATEGVYVAGNRNNEMDGLRDITNVSRTLHGINSATAGNEFWNGVRLDASAGVAGESLFEQLMDSVGAGGNGEVEAIITTRGIRRRLADTYQSQKRFNDAQAVTVHGGYSAIMVNEVPVVADDDAPKGFAFGINKSSLKWFEQTRPGWLESKDGMIFHLKVTAAAPAQRDAVWQAWFRWYAALGSVAPNRNGQVFNAQDDTPA
jgi:hypothetical protein